MAPLATGPGAIAVGIGTKATATASAAFGKGITANETESLALSGIAYAKNFYFNGDPRLVEDVQDVEPSQMLRNTEKLRVVSHAPSRNYCRHQGRAAADCARDRSVGLLADKAPPDAVHEGTSLTLGDPTRGGRVLEHVVGVQSLDVRALLAQLGLRAGALGAAPLEGRSDRGARQAKPGAGSPRRGARDGGGAAVRTSVKIISGANSAQDERQTVVATSGT